MSFFPATKTAETHQRNPRALHNGGNVSAVWRGLILSRSRWPQANGLVEVWSLIAHSAHIDDRTCSRKSMPQARSSFGRAWELTIATVTRGDQPQRLHAEWLQHLQRGRLAKQCSSMRTMPRQSKHQHWQMQGKVCKRDRFSEKMSRLGSLRAFHLAPQTRSGRRAFLRQPLNMHDPSVPPMCLPSGI